MTTVAVLAGCPSAVVVATSLMAAGIPVTDVVALGSDAAEAAKHVPVASTSHQLVWRDATRSDSRPFRIHADLALCVFTVGPVTVDCDVPAVVEVLATGRSTPHWDPVVEAVLSGSPTLPVIARLTTRDTTIREVAYEIPLDGSSTDVAMCVAAAVASSLGEALRVRSEPPGRRWPAGTDFAPLPRPCLDWPQAWDELDWSRPSDVLRRAVRAAALPGRRAWTWFGGARLGISAAVETVPVAPGVPAGTVVGHTGGGVIVQTGSAALRIGGLRDLLGPVDAAQVPIGARLGHDALADLANLTRRVQDLERLVLTIAGDTDLLDRPGWGRGDGGTPGRACR